MILELNKVVLSSFVSGLAKLQLRHLQNFDRCTEMMFFQEPRFVGGLRHFLKERNQLKMNLQWKAFNNEKH